MQNKEVTHIFEAVPGVGYECKLLEVSFKWWRSIFRIDHKVQLKSGKIFWTHKDRLIKKWWSE